MGLLEDVLHGALARGTNSATLALLNACLVGCALVCASLVFLPVGLPSELLPHIVGLLLLAVTLAGSVNWLVSLTGTVSPEEQQRELFGEARSELAPAGSSTSPLPPTSAPSPPPVEQPAAVPEPPLSAAALAGGAGGVEIGETTAAKDKDQ